ncbi:MAG TPA: rhodanese-like domain-containing protein [Prolixibacteraceae bacterium]|nr:rhodanese-like domain-containing protein [Prolixibacteraceae bacterium]
MLEAIKKFMGIKTTDYAQLMELGAIIVDVRTGGEFSQGHIKGSVNIPVDRIARSADQLKAKKKPVITCCASGMRSATAKSILESKGIAEVYNGGSWHGLNRKINRR